MSSNYEIGSGMSPEELKLASWWVRHRPGLHRLGYGTLIVLDVVLWSFILWFLLDTYAISYPRESRITQAIVQHGLNPQGVQSSAPQSIQTSEVLNFQSTDNRQDFLILVTNPNPNWWVEFTYRFMVGGEPTPARHGYLLPQSQHYLTELGWKGTGRSAQFQVSDLAWHRLKPELVERNYPSFVAKRLQLTFDPVTYKNDLTLDSHRVGQTSFVLHNVSAYGFWAVDLNILLYRKDAPMAVTTITEREIKPGESRPITINWFENLPDITKTEIRASVNLLDPSAYLPSNRF